MLSASDVTDGAMSDEAAAAADNTQTSASSIGSGMGVGTVTGTVGHTTTTTAGDKWNCDVCTYENYPMSKKCTMCRAAKPLLNEDILRLQEGASALPVSDGDEISERLKPLRISSPQDNMEKWPCPKCTYENWPRSPRCVMCGAPPPRAMTLQPIQPQHKAGSEDNIQGNHPIGINDICNSESSETRRSKRRNNIDWLWLQACLGVVEDDFSRVSAYLSSGGDPARALTSQEVTLLGRSSAFDTGHTLVHLAIRFQRQDILSSLLSRISGGGPGLKRSPSYIAADVAACIRRQVSVWLRALSSQRTVKPALSLAPVFCLPPEIEELPMEIQDQLFSELLDREAQTTLEGTPPLINWSSTLLAKGSRQFALWNRHSGDCLVDAALQAAVGVADRQQQLRQALDECFTAESRRLFERWAGAERRAARELGYSPEEPQLRREWARLVSRVRPKHHALHQIHIFALAQVLRRPIIVYGVNIINSFRGEALGYANFQGIYLPLLWSPAECSTSPLCIGYTRGHFCALVTMQPIDHYICREKQEEEEPATYLPLTDCEGKLLPVHFLTADELHNASSLVSQYLWEVYIHSDTDTDMHTHAHTDAHTHAHTPPLRCCRRPGGGGGLLTEQLTDDWLNYYRSLQTRGPFPPRLPPNDSSDADTDDE